MIRSSFFRWKSASGCDSKVLIDLNLSYGGLAIKLNFQPLRVCVFAPVPRNLDEGKVKLYLDLVCSGVDSWSAAYLAQVGRWG